MIRRDVLTIGAKKAAKNDLLVMQWDTDLFSVETRGDGKGYFVNHSCDPNLWMHGVYSLTAMRDIKKGEECNVLKYSSLKVCE